MNNKSIFLVILLISSAIPAHASKLGDCIIGIFGTNFRNPAFNCKTFTREAFGAISAVNDPTITNALKEDAFYALKPAVTQYLKYIQKQWTQEKLKEFHQKLVLLKEYYPSYYPKVHTYFLEQQTDNPFLMFLDALILEINLKLMELSLKPVVKWQTPPSSPRRPIHTRSTFAPIPENWDGESDSAKNTEKETGMYQQNPPLISYAEEI